MKKLKAFTKIDLIVVVGLILVLFGASLTMIGRTINKDKDEQALSDASQIFSYIKKYHDTNFNMYPVYNSDDSVNTTYRHVVLGDQSADANFLITDLGAKYSSYIGKVENPENLVYVYKTDGSEATIVVRKLSRLTEKCNTGSETVPNIIKEYLLQDPTACYYVEK